MTADAAYVAAGYKRNSGNAIRMKGNERVASRVAELKQLAAERVIISEAEVMQEVTDIAMARPTDKLTHQVKLNALRVASELLGMTKRDQDATRPINIVIAEVDLKHA
jgi:hypothetical protein